MRVYYLHSHLYSSARRLISFLLSNASFPPGPRSSIFLNPEFLAIFKNKFIFKVQRQEEFIKKSSDLLLLTTVIIKSTLVLIFPYSKCLMTIYVFPSFSNTFGL